MEDTVLKKYLLFSFNRLPNLYTNRLNIWPKMKKNHGEKYEQDGRLDGIKADERKEK